MKNIRTILLCACTSFMGLCAAAQSNQNDKIPINEPDYNKPRLFDELPSKIAITIDELSQLINSTTGQKTSFSLQTDSPLKFEGEVVSVASKYDQKIQSTVIRSANFQGATFTLSRILQDDGSYTFTGRIISFQHGDLFELKKDGNHYILLKKGYYELVNE